jgi:hypothetical protein
VHNHLLREIVVSYPWIFWAVVYLVLRFFPTRVTDPASRTNKVVFVNKLHWINPWWLAAAVIVACFMRYLYAIGYRYESQIITEVIVPLFVAGPYLKKLVSSYRMMALCLFPIMVLTVVEQLWCTKFGQWSYILSNGNKYLLWARANGHLWERAFHFGGIDYPLIELVFYPAYIIGTFTIAAVAIEVLPRKWRDYQPSLGWFFPLVFGTSAAILLVLSAWFIASRHTIPFHALAAFMSLFLSWLMVLLSPQVKKLTQTKIFIFGTVFSVIQTAIFEFYHAGIDGHWIYHPENELASLSNILFFKFPQWSVLGSMPNSWPIEEWCAYPTLFVFIVMYLLFFHAKLKIPVLQHEIVNPEPIPLTDGNTLPPIPQQPAKPEALMDVYKSKQGELSGLLTHYINSFAIAAGINGALLKFALEQGVSPQLQKVLIVFGAGFSFLGILACIFGDRVRRAIAGELAILADSLSLPQSTSSTLVLQFASVVVTIFASSCLIGWMYLWLR